MFHNSIANNRKHFVSADGRVFPSRLPQYGTGEYICKSKEVVDPRRPPAA
jgi:hypothetical protein